uniref:Uncharacterized protein n=1 Tax=Schistocephalus solidus TaxID=70667 RepID=A0A0V0J9Z1_SCHSO
MTFSEMQFTGLPYHKYDFVPTALDCPESTGPGIPTLLTRSYHFLLIGLFLRPLKFIMGLPNFYGLYASLNVDSDNVYRVRHSRVGAGTVTSALSMHSYVRFAPNLSHCLLPHPYEAGFMAESRGPEAESGAMVDKAK